MWSDTPQIPAWHDRYPLSDCPTRLTEKTKSKLPAGKGGRIGDGIRVSGGQNHAIRYFMDGWGIEKSTFLEIFAQEKGSAWITGSRVGKLLAEKIVREIEKRGYKPCH
jgi:hypothetical protein